MTTPRGVSLFYDPLFLGHDTLDHMENGGRVQACMDLLEEGGLLELLERQDGRDATIEELSRVHTLRHVEVVRDTAGTGPVWLDPDTVANSGSYAAAVRAAGACLKAVELVVRGSTGAAFCLTRPPGHHARPGAAMGFCLFNSVAVAAAHARVALGLDRVAIIDFDLHHGNGTQEAFYGSDSVLYVSTHQYPFYPGSGGAKERGAGPGLGATLNLPLPAGCGDTDLEQLFEGVIGPKLTSFRPQLILVSAGYDAHFADPISGAGQRLTCAGYYEMVRRIQQWADELCQGRVFLSLEGGYDPAALAWSVRNSLEALLGKARSPDPLGAPPPLSRRPQLDGMIEEVKELHGLA